MENKIGQVPEFTSDETVQEEVVEPTIDPIIEGEIPADPPPAIIVEDPQVVGLKKEKADLLNEIKDLRGERRDLKQKQIDKVDAKIESLDDVNPADVEVVEKILRSKGYMKQEEFQKMTYESVKNDTVESFLEKYPEYKPENDPQDTNWSALQREIALYRMPDDPKKISLILEKAHRELTRSQPASQTPAKKQQVVVASHGAGGTQRPQTQSKSRLTPDQKQAFSQGGWSAAEIEAMDK